MRHALRWALSFFNRLPVVCAFGCAEFRFRLSNGRMARTDSVSIEAGADKRTSKIEEIKKYFRDRGLSAKDIPAAFVVHELISVSFAAATWSVCYYAQPSKTVARPVGRLVGASNSKAIHKVYESAVGRAQKTVARMPWVKNNAARLTVSLAESTTFRAVMKPVTVGGKLWGTWEIMKRIKRPTKPGTPEADVKLQNGKHR